MQTPIYLIITAAGSSSRMASSTPKPLITIMGKTILERAYQAFSCVSPKKTVITTPPHLKKQFAELFHGKTDIEVIPGGRSRAESISLAIKRLPKTGKVLIHDAARPLVDSSLIKRVQKGLAQHAACIPVIPLTDTIKQIDNQMVTRTLPRHKLFATQTPQGFDLKIYAEVLEGIDALSAHITDDASIFEQCGHSVFTVAGNPRNLKITHEQDLELVKFYLEQAQD